MSTAEIKLITKIRDDYSQEQKGISKLERLKQLNKKAKRPAQLFAYIFGILGTLILGTGMCLVMPEVAANMMTLGVVVGVVGIIFVSVNYFIYKKLLANGKRKYSEQIINLSDELLKK